MRYGFRMRCRITVVLMTAMAVACSRSDTAPGGSGVQGDGASRIQLRVATAPYLAFAPLYVADRRGYFEEEGLDVEFVPLVSSEIAVPLLVDGSIDVLPSQASPGLLNAISRGARIRLVGRVHDAASAGCSPIQIVARPGLLEEYERARTPPVRRVSLNRQAVMTWLADVALSSAGLALDSLEIVDIPDAVEADAIESGAVDAALAGEPWLSRTVSAGKADPWIAITDVMPDIEVTLLFFGERLLDQDRDAGVRFLRALHGALESLGDGPTPANVTLLAEITGESPDVLRKACWAFRPSREPVRLKSIARFQRWALEHGLVENVLEGEELWDGVFMEALFAATDTSPQ